MIQRQLELATPASVAAALGLGREPETHLPQQLAPGESEPITAADPHECFDRRSFESRRSASYEIADALERSVLLTLQYSGGRLLFAPNAAPTPTHSHCPLVPAPPSPFFPPAHGR